MTAQSSLTLTGFHDSVYTWAVRWALAEMGLAARYDELNPFDDTQAAGLRGLHPFGQVPVLRDGDFVLYETAAILRYLDRLAPGPDRIPAAPRAEARMWQVISIINGQVYGPLVRQVFSNGYYLPRMEQAGDTDALGDGLAAAPRVLDALDAIAQEGLVLTGQSPNLADLMLAPMLCYFGAVDAGARLIARRPALAAWLAQMQARPALAETRPPCLTEASP